MGQRLNIVIPKVILLGAKLFNAEGLTTHYSLSSLTRQHFNNSSYSLLTFFFRLTKKRDRELDRPRPGSEVFKRGVSLSPIDLLTKTIVKISNRK